jgi:hypothetical protein
MFRAGLGGDADAMGSLPILTELVGHMHGRLGNGKEHIREKWS